MKNSFGNNITITLYGESHGSSVGCVIDGLASGIPVDENNINQFLALRRPNGTISTSRCEADEFSIKSGVFNGYTTGTPICIDIPNEDKRSLDYKETANLARPSHADYTANCKYNGYQDYRGGGHFSGRITAAIVAAGGIIIPALKRKGISIGTHIKSCGGVEDRDFSDYKADIELLSNLNFAVLDNSAGSAMQEKIIEAKNNLDSIGGVLETAVIGIDAGIGEPWFDSVESLISHAMFSVPGIKGIEFGAGFEIANMTGSTANDEFSVNNGSIVTNTNNSGGINGGITNGMPIVFRCAVRPTPTIGKEQKTINFKTNENTILAAKGRHDPCIAHRARIVVDSLTAIVIADLLTTKYGTDWLAK